MWRTFGIQTLSGNAQPIFGDALTANLVIKPDGSGVMTVARTLIYQEGDRITLNPGGANQNTVLVEAIISSTQMVVAGQGATIFPHLSGTVLSLDIACSDIIIQAGPENNDAVYLGADSTVTNTGGGSVVFIVIPGYPFYTTNNVQFNSVRTNDLWMAGTASQFVTVAAQVV
jgi:hypothetical protein